MKTAGDANRNLGVTGDLFTSATAAVGGGAGSLKCAAGGGGAGNGRALTLL